MSGHADNVSNNQDQSYFNVPADKYFVIWNRPLIIMHAGLAKFTLLTTILFTAIACLTNWWQLLTIRALTYIYIENWGIGFSSTALAIVIGYFYYTRQHKRRLRIQQENMRRRRYEDAVIKNSGVTKKK